MGPAVRVAAPLYVAMHVCWAGIALGDLWGDLELALTHGGEYSERLVDDFSSWALPYYLWQLGVLVVSPCIVPLAPLAWLVPGRLFATASARRAAALQAALAAD